MNKSFSVTGAYLRILEFSSIVVVEASAFKCKTEMTVLANSYSYYTRKSLSTSSLNCHIKKTHHFSAVITATRRSLQASVKELLPLKRMHEVLGFLLLPPALII